MLVYKSLNQICPEYMTQLFNYQSNSTYKMRSETQKMLALPKVNCELFRKSLIYSGAVLWNQLPLAIHTAKSLSWFKKFCFTAQMSTTLP